MVTLCNNTSLWDTDLVWINSWPQFTDCFQTTVLVWVPCGWLWLSSPFYICYILNTKPTLLLSRWKYYLKVTICMTLVMVSVLQTVIAAMEDGAGQFASHYIAPTVQIVTFVYAILVMIMERKKGFVTSGVLFIFWFLLTVTGIIPFYTMIIQQDMEDHQTKFAIFCVYYTLVIFQMVLGCFPETVAKAYTRTCACPEVSSSFLSRITFWWMNSLLMSGYRKTLTESDVFDLHPRVKSVNNVPSFLTHKQKEKEKLRLKSRNDKMLAKYTKANRTMTASEELTLLIPKTSVTNSTESKHGSHRKKGGASLVNSLWKTLWLDILQAHIWKFIYDLLYFTNPLLLGGLITFTEDKASPLWKGYTLACFMFCSTLLQSLTYHATWHQSTFLALRVRSILISAIFRKSLTLSCQARRESTVGEIINLMSVDAEHVKILMQWLWGSWSSLLQVVVSLYLLYNTLGISMFAGLGALVIVTAFIYVVTTLKQSMQRDMMKLKDKRLKIINEVLNGMKILKLYAWEQPYQEKVTKVRRQELHSIWKIAKLSALETFIWIFCPYLLSLTTLMTYILTTPDHFLNPKTAFVAIALFNNLRGAVIILPEIITNFVQAYVSLSRIDTYLNGEDMEDDRTQFSAKQDNSVSVINGTFSWYKETGSVLKNINMSVEPGQLVAIVGRVGAGKSSLMSAILGEMVKVTGQVSLKGNLAYVSQQAWIQHDTLQNNILFGKPMNRYMYDKVVECCALKPDLEMLPGGDQTEIGERGVNLSGGQKQRVSLARAVYSNADIYLLDDPLSAVDSHVGRHIFNKLLSKGGLIGKKTRILVTHSIHWLPVVDVIMVVTNGHISERGTYNELLQHNGPFARFLQTYLLEKKDNNDPEETEMKEQVLRRLESVTSEDETHDQRELMDLLTVSLRNHTWVGKLKENTHDETETDMHKIVGEEVVNFGKVPWSVYGLYARAVGWGFIICCLGLYVVYQSGSVSSNIWLSLWTDDPDLNNFTLFPPNNSVRLDMNSYYLEVYGGLGFIQAGSGLVFFFLWGFRSVQAACALHDELLSSIMKAPMTFFDTTPVGRMVNRFSEDVEAVDVNMTRKVGFLLNSFLLVLSCLIVITYSTPLFLAMVVPMIVLYVIILVFYINTSRQLKRLESKTRSPIYSHFGETITGASVIRAFKVQSRFIMESDNRIDKNQQFSFYSFVSQRWLGFWLETLGNFIVLGAAMFTVSSRDTLSGGTVGLSLSYAMQITQNLNWLVRTVSDTESQIVSVERIQQYTEVKPEASGRILQHRPPHSWPHEGVVRFLEYSTRYRPGQDLVLKGITFTVHSGEKVGIVGRTGAGKSSLTLSLFRLIEAAAGQINIDGVDISTIGLHDLRKKLTILPQDPALFSGSLRENVDPFNQYSDSEIWRALDHAHLKSFVQELHKTLEHDCSEGGENISEGQRQLLCLARALLKKTKILILDEATAGVDIATDDMIQQTIRSEFKDCTVLTIAHRLNTVMDYDRILVLDNGCVVEYDSPCVLLQRQDGIFYRMCKSAGLTY